MKTKLILLLLGIGVLFTPSKAQEHSGNQARTKKVAVLLPIDRQGNVNYFLKAMVKGKLTNAITSISGYEAYERTDIDAIFEEQAFQRTGHVSDEQIQKMGVIEGVAYVLVSEIAQSENDVYIQAKLMSVKTAKVEQSSDQLCSANPKQMEEGCLALVRKMFGQGDTGYGLQASGSNYTETEFSGSTSMQSDDAVYYYLIANDAVIRSRGLANHPEAANNLKYYTKLDADFISDLKVFETQSSNVILYSQHPAWSYKFDTQNPRNVKIMILNPKAFWGTSRVCLIGVK